MPPCYIPRMRRLLHTLLVALMLLQPAGATVLAVDAALGEIDVETHCPHCDDSCPGCDHAPDMGGCGSAGCAGANCGVNSFSPLATLPATAVGFISPRDAMLPSRHGPPPPRGVPDTPLRPPNLS